MNPIVTPAWMFDTPCGTVPPDLFFPSTGETSSAQTAKHICSTCPVQLDCLTYALADPHLFGIWGGTTESDRDKLRRAAA